MTLYPSIRLRRLRTSPQMRAFVNETTLNLQQIVYPIFVEEGSDDDRPIPLLPGQSRIAEKNLGLHIQSLYKKGIRAVLLFGVSKKKDHTGSESLRKGALLDRMIRISKNAQPEMLVISDNCFCEYTEHGHCGILSNNDVDNDQTLEKLAQQAVLCAAAGADIVAPSAMMDGQVFAIRKALDQEGFINTSIMSYSTKFCSSFYGPFREAADSSFKGSRKTYQLNYANTREALRESLQDAEEGADFLMVKPAGTSLDIIQQIAKQNLLPVAAYQVSGEYAALKFAAKAGVLQEDAAILETLISIKRAGASIIITYFAPRLAELFSQHPNYMSSHV